MLPTVESGPARAKTSVVWLHGLGADGHDFAPIVPVLGLPLTRFVFPHAPRRPVTINGGMKMRAWYDIRTLEAGANREPEADIRASEAEIIALLDREAERGAEHIVLLGFSQGAAMALHAGLRWKQTLAGVGVLSGYLVLPDAPKTEHRAENLATPLLFCHGRYDEVVPMARGVSAYTAFSGRKGVTWREYDMGHEVVPKQIGDLKTWLTQRLGGS